MNITNSLKVDRKKQKNFVREDLLKLTQEELVDIIIQLQANNVQLKNVISKGQQSNSNAEGGRKGGRQFDFSRYQTRRIFLRIAYLGSNYRGLAVQEDCPDTIEAHLFHALTKSCLIKCREESFYHRCGRTDKGVSASGQVLSLQVRSCLSVEELNCKDGGYDKELNYCGLLNRLLPNDIRAISWAPASLGSDGEYHSARFDCKQRIYKYWFPKGCLNINNMREACKYLIGSNDFRNLCKMDVANGVTSFVRDLTHASIEEERHEMADHKGYEMYYLLIKANAFLWHQIRCIAGVLFLIGNGDEEPNIIKQLLDIGSNPRKPQYSMAIDLPLNLFRCSYDFIESNIQNEGNAVTESDKSCNIPMDTADTMQEYKMKKTKWRVDLCDLEKVIKNFQVQWTKMAIQAAMIKDIIRDLEDLYNNSIHDDNCQHKEFSFQSDCMLEGVKPKLYQPLLKRVKCESLENRIDHYVKKKRLKVVSDIEDNDSKV